jgi:hypothetical protein
MEIDLQGVIAIHIYPLVFHVLEDLIHLALIEGASSALLKGLFDLVILLHG